MATSDNDYSITYNGEIFNYIELRNELINLNYSFNTLGDTEVLLKAYCHWGVDCLSKLNGMFSFAILDRKNRILFCARDCFGIKPFFYTTNDDEFAFTSDITGMLKMPGVQKDLDYQTCYEYLLGGRIRPGESTFFRHIKKLPPAHYAIIPIDTPDQMQVKRYWEPKPNKKINISFNDAAQNLKSIFLDSVNKHLRSDVPIGCALSGGLDSSAIACSIHHLQPDAKIDAFTFSAQGCKLDESPYARLVAKHCKAKMHEIYINPTELASDIDSLILHQGEPFNSTSIYAQYRVFKSQQSANITVSLDGQGGDEVLGGYFGYIGACISSKLTNLNFYDAYCYAKNACSSQNKHNTWKSILSETLAELTPDKYKHWGNKILHHKIHASWINHNEFIKRDVSPFIVFNPNKYFKTKHFLKKRLAYALNIEGIETLLRYADRNSMAFSIESRVPFLTREMVDFALSIPESYLVTRECVTKAVFRKAMKGIVPDEIINRKDKIGFATPEQSWLLNLDNWVKEIIGESKAIFLIDSIKALNEWELTKQKKVPFSWTTWRCICFLRWLQIFDISP